MRALLAVALLGTLLMSGCAGDEPAAQAVVDAENVPLGLPGQAASGAGQPMRFATAAFEGNLSGTQTFDITQQYISGQTGGEAVIDLTPIIPADAPVELTVSVYGANSAITYTDAFVVGFESGQVTDYDGQKGQYAGLVVRAPAGTVVLHVYNPGGFGIPPQAAPTADWQARGVVRPDRLVAGLPAAVQLAAGDRLEFPSENVEEVVLIAPDGTITRDQSSPFELVANGTSGQHIVMMAGSDSTEVLGPNATLVPRRLVRVDEEPHPVDGPTAWSYTPPGVPLQLGLVVQSQEGPVATPFFGGMDPTAVTLGWTFSITGPGGVTVLDGEDPFCQPFCLGYRSTTSTDLLDEALRPGAYDVDLQFQGSGAEAYLFAVVVV